MPKPRPAEEEQPEYDEPEQPTEEPEPDARDLDVSENRKAFLAGEMRWRDYCQAEAEAHAEPLDS